MAGNGNINWRIEVKPDPKQIERAFGELSRKLMDWRPAFTRLIPVIAAGERAIFNSKGSVIGEPWHAVTEMYARRKERKGGGRLQNFLTGALRGELTSRAGVLSMTKKKLTFGTDLPYARAIHFGQKNRLIGWTNEMQERAREIFAEQAEALMQQAAAAIGGK